MSGLVVGTSSSTELQDLNRALLLLSIPPVRSLNGLPMTSDGGLVLNTLRTNQRSVAARGWWWNTDRRVTLSPVAGTVTADPATSVRSSRRRPGDDYTPEVRLVAGEGATGGTLWNIDDDDAVFDNDVIVDIIRPYDATKAPQLFRDYCLMRTVADLATVFGAAFEPRREERALFDLERAEAENMENVNLLNTDPDVVDTWYR